MYPKIIEDWIKDKLKDQSKTKNSHDFSFKVSRGIRGCLPVAKGPAVALLSNFFCSLVVAALGALSPAARHSRVVIVKNIFSFIVVYAL
jgi:hypothetical protein